MDPNKTARYHDFMEKYLSLQRLMRHTKRDRQKCNAWLLVGIHSINQGNPVMISQISAKLDITNAAATQMVDTLETQGFVRRFSDENDRRVTMVALTDNGRSALKFLFMQTTATLDGLFEHLGEEDTQHLMRLIDKAMEYFMATTFNQDDKK